jgi:putative PIN family toxin of toxin-antitoxin system
MTAIERVVFDCNVYFQALISPSGPARRLIELAADGRLEVYGSTTVLEELKDVVVRPNLRRKLP